MKISKNKSGIYAVRFKTSTGKFTTKSLGVRSYEEAKKLVKDAKIEEIETAAKVGALTRDVFSSIVAGKQPHIQDMISEWKFLETQISEDSPLIVVKNQ